VSAPLEPLVKNDMRLDLLSCLVDGESLTIQQLSARTGKEDRHVCHHMKLLESFGLVEQNGNVEGGQTLYVARLSAHPEWVAEAVRDHRRVC
jgi:DNA-binding transcriptional ArsR family regulator